MSSSTDWIFWIIGGVLGAGGLALLLRALFADRARGRKRCPKCWYDMSAAPSLTCSECGHDVRSEKRLLKTRRRWRWVLPALILFIAAAGAALTPKVKRDGWQSIVPTSVLVLCLPSPEDGNLDKLWRRVVLDELLYERLDIRNVRNAGDPPGATDWQWRLILKWAGGSLRIEREKTREPPSLLGANSECIYVVRAALRRGVVHRLGLEEELGKIFRDREPLAGVSISFPGNRPVDAPLPVYVRSPNRSHPLGSIGFRLEPRIAWNDEPLPWDEVSSAYPPRSGFGHRGFAGTITMPPSVIEGRASITCLITFHVTPSYSPRPQDPRLEIGSTECTNWTYLIGRLDEVVRPLDDPMFDELIRRGFGWALDVETGALDVHLDRACLGELDRIGEVARLELLRGGEVIHHQSRTLLAELPEGGPYRPAATFDLFPEDLPQEVLDAMLDGACTMRFRIDPADVLTWTNHYTYWDGAMEIPVDWEDVRKAYRR